MSKEARAFDIRGFFGGAKTAVTIPTGKPIKKAKEAKDADGVAAPTDEASASPAPADAPEPKKAATPSRATASPAKVRSPAATASAPEPSSGRRRTPVRSAASAAREAVRAVAEAEMNERVGVRWGAADDDDDDEDALPVVRRAPARAAQHVAPAVAIASLFAAEEDEEEDVRVGDARKAHTHTHAHTPAPAPAPAPAAKTPAPVEARPALKAVDAATFFGSGPVLSGGKDIKAHAGAAGGDAAPDDVFSAKAAAAQMRVSLPVPEAAVMSKRAGAAAAISVDSDDDDDVNLLSLKKGARAAAPVPAPAPATKKVDTAPASTASPARPTQTAKRPRMEAPAVEKSPAKRKESAPVPAPAPVATAPTPTKPAAAPRPSLAPLTAGFIPPRGAPNCLAGTKWCATGELTTMTRDQAIAIIRDHGGDSVSGVSSLVSHLLIGEKLEDGRPVDTGSKYQKAMQLRAAAEEAGPPDPSSKKKVRPVIQLVREKEFIEMLESTLPPEERPDRSVVGAPATVSAVISASSERALSGSAAASRREPAANELLWVDKYKPTDFSHVVGNAKELSALDAWLTAWHDVHVTGTREKPKHTRENPGARAALISGPPGIGKTTCAVMLARRHGFDVLEMNASDARSKLKLQNELEGVTDNLVLHFGGAASASAAPAESTARRLIIMDEVDGMSSGDRGGNAELIKIIKSTRTPIICICNDRQKPSVRTLVNHCYDVKFTTPSVEAISQRLRAIAGAEGMTVDDDAVRQLAEACGRDLRSCINSLHMWAATSKHVSAASMKDRLSALNKDAYLRLDAFSATPRIFTEARAPLDHRLELFYVDYDLAPLLVHQVYPNTISNASSGDMLKLQRMSLAADAISEGDICADYVRGRQAWGLLPSLAMASVRAATLAAGQPPGLSFPTYLAKNSSRNKRARLLAELGLRIAPHISGGREAIRLDYLAPLRDTIMAPLVAPGAAEDAAAAAGAAIRVLDEYGLSKDDFTETMMDEVTFEDDAAGMPRYAKMIDSRVKATLTREYNKMPHKAQSLGSIAAGAVASMRGGRRGAATVARISADGEEVEDEEEEGDDGGDAENGSDEDGAATSPVAAKPAASARGRGRGGRGGGGTAGTTRGRGRARGAAAASASAGSKRPRAAIELSDDDDDDDDDE